LEVQSSKLEAKKCRVQVANLNPQKGSFLSPGVRLQPSRKGRIINLILVNSFIR